MISVDQDQHMLSERSRRRTRSWGWGWGCGEEAEFSDKTLLDDWCGDRLSSQTKPSVTVSSDFSWTRQTWWKTETKIDRSIDLPSLICDLIAHAFDTKWLWMNNKTNVIDLFEWGDFSTHRFEVSVDNGDGYRGSTVGVDHQDKRFYLIESFPIEKEAWRWSYSHAQGL